MKYRKYKSFDKYVLRTPLYPVNFYLNITSEENIAQETILNIFKSPEVREAIFLSSKSLYDRLLMWEKGRLTDQKAIKNIRISFLKYLFRMSTRCTPFGLLAGCSLGTFQDTTAINLKPIKNHVRHIKLDTRYVISLANNLKKDKTLSEQLCFYPNSSIYTIGKQIKYIERKLNKDIYDDNIVSIEQSELLEKLLKKLENGLTEKDILEFLLSEGYPETESKLYIKDLIRSQVIQSELEPNIIGDDFFSILQKSLKNKLSIESILFHVNGIKKSLDNLNTSSTFNVKKYNNAIQESLIKANPIYTDQYFQNNLEIKAKSNQIDYKILDEIYTGIKFLNKITLPKKNTSLDKFKSSFYERYENREISLAKALDLDIGLNYKQQSGEGAINPLVDDIIISNSLKNDDFKVSPIETILNKKIIQATRNGDTIIKLFDSDFSDFEESWSDLPDTFWAKAEVGKINAKEKIKLNMVGGASGAKLLTRFCFGNEGIKGLVNEIYEKEKRINSDKILAEISHLPEDKTANILSRPSFTEYEIPYLSKSILSYKNQLLIKDMTMKINRKGKLVIKCKGAEKEVLPRLTNAHSYWRNNTHPIYHFLADLQTQNKRTVLELQIGQLKKYYDFIPRFEYKNIVLKEATWRITQKEIFNYESSYSNLLEGLKCFVEQKQIPQYFFLLDGDNKLLINSKNKDSLEVFFHSIKKKKEFEISECLFIDDTIVKNTQGNYYMNEIIIPFYRKDEK